MIKDKFNFTRRSSPCSYINPEEWLEDVLIKLPDTKITDLASVLPNVWKKSEEINFN